MDIDYIPVTGADAIEAGACKAFEITGVQFVLAHLSDGFHAVENRCTHAGRKLETNRLYKGRQIVCPLHGARFDLKTGAAKSPPAYRPLAIFPVRIADGRIEVGFPRKAVK